MHRQIEPSYTPSPGRLYGVAPDAVEGLWEQVAPILVKSLKYADSKYSLESIRHALIRRDMQLWMYVRDGIKACGVTQVVKYPEKKVCVFMFAVGEVLSEWIQFDSLIEEWARDNQCDAIEIYGRPGWEKVLGWERIHVVIRKNLHESTH